jgi:hypothetical protein
MSRRRVTGFYDWRGLFEPDGPPTARQLLALHLAGALLLVEPDPAHRFTRGEADAGIDAAVEAGHLQPQRGRRRSSASERFDRVCREIVEYVAADPGCSTADVCRSLRSYSAGWAYIEARVRDLLELGVLENRAAKHGRGHVRELWLHDAADEAAERGTPTSAP